MYKVLIDTLNHNGRKRVPGELIEMDDVDAVPLIKIRAIEAAATVAVNPLPPGLGDEGDTGNKDPKTDNTDSGNQAQPQTAAAQSDGIDASQSAVQEQAVVSASANATAGSDAPKSGRKESKPKTTK